MQDYSLSHSRCVESQVNLPEHHSRGDDEFSKTKIDGNIELPCFTNLCCNPNTNEIRQRLS